MEQIPFIRRPKDWPFPIPEITAEAINDLVDAIERGDRYLLRHSYFRIAKRC